ncbi:MAG: hypothetical protein ACRDQU_08480 [Pseudonocardiaceae bacterium]
MIATPAALGVIARRLRQPPEWLVALAVGAMTLVICVIPQWRGTFFYYVGDQYEWCMPLWHRFGEQLRGGRWPLTMDPDGWMGGNYAAEAQTGIWNPVNIVNFVVVSLFNNLSHAAFVVAVEFLGLLAGGVYLLAREYDASRAPANNSCDGSSCFGIHALVRGFRVAVRAHGRNLGYAFLVGGPPPFLWSDEPVRTVRLRVPRDDDGISLPTARPHHRPRRDRN